MPTSGPGDAVPTSGKIRPDAKARDSRRATQLRENLFRRKRQQRARTAVANGPPDE